ncbi:MAG: fluoride efflux transporter CrcB [Chloroflexi bacterium]|nr:fluoride efflux transporter CrcB [Chloroflexota bacterium]
MERVLLVGIGAFFGAIARYGLTIWLAERLGDSFPYGTLVVNVTGSFLLGFAVVLTTERLGYGPGARLLVGTGFCGGYTTFSTFAFESLALVEGRAYAAATLNILLSVALSIVGVAAGIWLARAL